MGVLFFVLALVFGAPIAKAIAHRIANQGPQPGSADPELRRVLQATEQRLADTETRLATVEEKLDFYEKLLSKPKE